MQANRRVGDFRIQEGRRYYCTYYLGGREVGFAAARCTYRAVVRRKEGIKPRVVRTLQNAKSKKWNPLMKKKERRKYGAHVQYQGLERTNVRFGTPVRTKRTSSCWRLNLPTFFKKWVGSDVSIGTKVWYHTLWRRVYRYEHRLRYLCVEKIVSCYHLLAVLHSLFCLQ